MLKSTIAHVVGASIRRPWVVIALALIVTLAAGGYAAARWTVNTDTMRIMPDSLPWRRTQIAYERAFPPRAILAVVEAPTAELTDLATATLAAALSTEHDRFHAVHRVQDDLFLRRESLLFRSPAEVARTAQQLGGAQPLFAELAADPTLRGAAGALVFGERAVAGGQARPDDLATPMRTVADTLDDVFAGRFASFSWRTLMGGAEPPDSRRGFIQIDPVLDTRSLQPGHAATTAIDQAAARTDIAGRFGAILRLTGTAPINDQQFSTLQRESKWTLLGTALAVLLILWLALRSGRIILAVALSLGAGFAVTAALGLLMIGSFNLISVAFAVLFVGLGADFGIQFSVRYRSERHDHDEVREALEGAARKAGVPLLLATAGTAAGFFSFLPTAYRGMAELGQIAGVGMLAALAATLTLLPALLTVLKPPGEPHRLGFKALAPVDRFLAGHRVAVVAGTIGVVLLASPLLLRLRLDFDATHMQPPNAPAVRAYHQLARDPQANIQAINVPAPSLQAARTLAQRLRSLPEVSGVRTVDVLVPTDQAAKLPLVERAAEPLGPALSPREVKPAPDDADDIAAIRQAATGLAPIERAEGGAGAAARRLRPLLVRLAGGGRRHPPPRRDRLGGAAPRRPRLAARHAAPGARHHGRRAGGAASRLAGAGRAGACGGGAARRCQRLRDHGPVRPRRAGGGAGSERRTGGAGGLGAHGDARLPGGGRGRGAVDRGDPVGDAAPSRRRAADPAAAAGGRPGHAGAGVADRRAAQLRQHHRPAAAARRRRRVQDLLHHRLARRRHPPAGNRADPGDRVLLPDHRDRVRLAVAVQPARPVQHGQADGAGACLHAGRRGAVPTGADGAAQAA